MTELDGLLDAVVADPLSEVRWLVLADWLEEFDDPRRAELLRLHRKLIATGLEPAHPERPAWQARVVALLAGGLDPCGPRRVVQLGGGVTMAFAFIPPGTFLMGTRQDEMQVGFQTLSSIHQVTLTKGFWIGMNPVIQLQWSQVMGNNPSRYFGDESPVETVSWDDCQVFCQKIAERTGQRFRLPTDAEWEYSCRAGTRTPFHFGETLCTDQANYDGSFAYPGGREGVYNQAPCRVGCFRPNAWGLYDLHGNVWEWCQDGLRRLSRGEVTDPRSEPPGRLGSLGRRILSGIGVWNGRVQRGGSWFDPPWLCRSAHRQVSAPDCRKDTFGLRVVMDAD